MNRIEFSNMLKNKRESLGTSKYKISKDTGLTALQLNRIETAANSYSMGNIFKYLNTIGCHIALYKGKRSNTFNNIEDFGVWVTKRRGQKMSMYALAKQIESNITTVTRIETNQSAVGVDLFLKIIEAFGYELKVENV